MVWRLEVEDCQALPAVAGVAIRTLFFVNQVSVCSGSWWSTFFGWQIRTLSGVCGARAKGERG